MIISEKLSNLTLMICDKLYQKGGVSAVCEFANKKGFEYFFCVECDTDIPVSQTIKSKTCLVCGQEIN